MATTQQSSLSQAFAGRSNTALDGLNNLAMAKSAPVGSTGSTKHHFTSAYPGTMGADRTETSIGLGLLTPPSSISPNLPEAFHANFPKDVSGSPPSQVDSDIDLEHADTAHEYDRQSDEDDDNVNVGSITPAFLAKYHLADLVLEKGPIAIRHVMNHLSLTVPGFKHIPGPKARRITVAALENKSGGGPEGNVEFEKVGWGRWDARLKGHFSRDARSIHTIREDKDDAPPLARFGAQSVPGALRIPGNGRSRPKQRRISHGSWTADSTHLSRSSGYADNLDRDVSESQADAMSIDLDEDNANDRYRPSSGYHHQSARYPFEESDTDSEDWSRLGPEVVRDSFSTSASSRTYNYTATLGTSSRSHSRGWSPYQHSSSYTSGKSVPASHWSNLRGNADTMPNLETTENEFAKMAPQEQDAVNALLSMGR